MSKYMKNLITGVAMNISMIEGPITTYYNQSATVLVEPIILVISK